MLTTGESASLPVSRTVVQNSSEVNPNAVDVDRMKKHFFMKATDEESMLSRFNPVSKLHKMLGLGCSLPNIIF